MSFGGNKAAHRLVKTGLGVHTFVGLAVAIGALSAMVAGWELAKPVHAVDPGGRAAIETAITLSAIVSAWLFLANFRHDRRLSELLLLCALGAVALVDCVYCAVPALGGGSGPELGGGARLACGMIVSLAFAAAAFVPDKTIPNRGRHVVGRAIAAATGVAILAAVLEQVTGSNWDAGAQDGGIGSAASPAALVVCMISAGILLTSAVAFLRRGKQGASRCSLLAGVSFLLAASRLQYLSMPAVAANWVTPREGLRLAAYAVLLAVAYGRYAQVRRTQAAAAIGLERERIARDLHDGLAQDLACIAAQGQRLGIELEPGHPLMIATRHALATSRGVIADLSASSAPTVEEALRRIADELEHRHGLRVEVRTDRASRLAGDLELEAGDRDHVVRIAREAIVNAALHGDARHVDVALELEGRDVLMRVTDDGCGIDEAPRAGLGLRTMRARAERLGGRLSAHPRPGGGTEVELLVTSPGRGARTRAGTARGDESPPLSAATAATPVPAATASIVPLPPPLPLPPDVADAMSVGCLDK
jgi:signal transduction histidine kinase